MLLVVSRGLGRNICCVALALAVALALTVLLLQPPAPAPPPPPAPAPARRPRVCPSRRPVFEPLYRAPSCRRSAPWPERACYGAEREPSPAELKLPGGARAAFAYPRRLLDILDHRLPDEASIFFVDASCQGDTQLRLSARSACAVEAAARLNPRRTVILLATAAYGISADPQGWGGAARALVALRNVRVAGVDARRFVHATPAGELFRAGAVARGAHPAAHAADLLRLVALWRFGGAALDQRHVATRPLPPAPFALTTQGRWALALACGAGGRRAAEEVLRAATAAFWCDARRAFAARLLARLLRPHATKRSVNGTRWPACGAALPLLPADALRPAPPEVAHRYCPRVAAAAAAGGGF